MSQAIGSGIFSGYLGTGVTLNHGYGLLIIANISQGTSAVYSVDASTAINLTNKNVYVTISKPSEYSMVITPDNPSNTIKYTFIACDM